MKTFLNSFWNFVIYLSLISRNRPHSPVFEKFQFPPDFAEFKQKSSSPPPPSPLHKRRGGEGEWGWGEPLSAFAFQLQSLRQYNCRGRILKTPAAPRQSFWRSNLTNLCICFSKRLAIFRQLHRESLTYSCRLSNHEINKSVNQLQFQGHLSSYKAAPGSRLANNDYLWYKNIF